MLRLAVAAVLVALAPPVNAAILVPTYGKTPQEVVANPDAFLRIDQTKGSNTQVDALADDLPSVWIGTGGASSSYWILRSTPRMWLWSVDSVVTVDEFDLAPFADAATLQLVVGDGAKVGGVVMRNYNANGVDIFYSYGIGVPEPSTATLGLFFGICGVGYLRRQLSRHD